MMTRWIIGMINYIVRSQRWIIEGQSNWMMMLRGIIRVLNGFISLQRGIISVQRWPIIKFLPVFASRWIIICQCGVDEGNYCVYCGF
jgi:hypothetical protein